MLTASAEGEPSSEHKPEPNSTVEPEPDVQPETWPEPGPKWNEAYKTWKSAWWIHVYLFATCFLLMAFYAAYYVIVNIYDGLDKKYLSISLNIMVLFFCLTRAFIMYLDPYHQGQIIKALQLMRILWSLGGPCLTASDSLIILALLETSRLKITLPALQKAKVIAVIVILHFVFVILTDFVVAEYVSAKGMILFCQVFYVVWGFTLGTGYIRLGYVLDKQLFSHKPNKDKQDKLYVWLIHASGIVNYFLVLTMIYTVFGVFGVYSDVEFVDAWSWWALQTVLRLSEVVTCILIFTVSAKRVRIQKAMDDIATMDSQVVQIPKLQSTPLQKMRAMLNKQKRVSVKPLAAPSWPARSSRRMSMFTHLETESKAVQGFSLENAFSRAASPTGSIDTQGTIDLEEGLDTNDNVCTNESPIVMFSKKRTSNRTQKNKPIGEILEECEPNDITEPKEKSFVRKISAHIHRKVSGLTVLSSGGGDESRCIMHRNSDLNAVLPNGEQNLGFDNSLPNTVSGRF